MKRKILIVTQSFFVVLMLASVARGEVFPQVILFDGTQNAMITSTYMENDYPRLSDNGHAVWREHYVGVGSRPMLYNGTSIVVLSYVYSYYACLPRINSTGRVVWHEGIQPDRNDQEIFLYDGTGTIQLTDNAYTDDEARINNIGIVVWQGQTDIGSDLEIFLYDGASVSQITDNDYADLHPEINNNGEIVWEGHDGSAREIFYYDGSAITQITNNTVEDYAPRINDDGLVVWYGQTDTHSDFEIFLYDGSSITQITDNDYADLQPEINSNGHMAWEGDREIYYYDGSAITRITNNDEVDYHPRINDNGFVVWEGGPSDGPFEIFLYDGTGTTQLTDNVYGDNMPDINNAGHVIWSGRRTLPDRPWGAASIMDLDNRSASPATSYLCVLVVPMLFVIILRRSRGRHRPYRD